MSLNDIDGSFRDPQQNKWLKDNFGVSDLTDSGAGITAGNLMEVSGGQVRNTTDNSATVIGITRGTVAASAGNVQSEYGAVPVKLASAVTKLDNLTARADGLVSKTLAAQVDIVALEAGGNYANQPAGDGVEIVSDSASDTQTCTIYGTITGSLTTVTSETVTLTGTSVKATTEITWETILGIELSSAAIGTITFREASGDAAITTITAAGTDSGIATLATTNGYGLVVRHDASGASSKNIGIIGIGPDGTAVSSVDALNGTTEEDHGTQAFGTVTKVLIGDVESAVNAQILTNEATDTVIVGIALETKTTGELCDADIWPYHRR